jgi:spore coat polysaccharide biosynthesis predicted glycosyltransferase SpsG
MTSERGTNDVLFRVAGGPRVGFGHVLRALSLARALAARPRMSVRGAATTRETARRLGAELDACATPRDLDPTRTRVLVVDDPSTRAARPWVRAARARGIGAISVHDLGIAPVPSDLAIDGSVAPGRHATASRVLRGLRYAVLDPRLEALRVRQPQSERTRAARVVVSLGGGARTAFALHLARAIRAAAPGVEVRVAGGFVTGATAHGAGIRTIAPTAFRRELAQATAAVLAGGVSLYEACALGVPAVAVSVVAGQTAAVRAFGRRGAAIDAGRVRASARGDAARTAQRVARATAALLASPDARRRLALSARSAIDGQGARRVADAIRALRGAAR